MPNKFLVKLPVFTLNCTTSRFPNILFSLRLRQTPFEPEFFFLRFELQSSYTIFVFICMLASILGQFRLPSYWPQRLNSISILSAFVNDRFYDFFSTFLFLFRVFSALNDLRRPTFHVDPLPMTGRPNLLHIFVDRL